MDDDDDDRYDYDVRGPRWDPNSKWSEYLRKQREEKRENEARLIKERIKAKGEYIEPEEFDIEKYKDFIEKTKNDLSKKKYDDFDAEKLYYYMLTLRHYYADAMYNFYNRFDPERLKTFSAYILGEISGNKLEFEEINYDRKLSKQNKEKFLYNEKELIRQRKDFFVYQTHHERTLQALFHKKPYFQVLQQRGLEAKLMNEMYNRGFYIDLAIKPTAQVKKKNKEDNT
ncbi:MAG: hypothetical protein IKA36_04320 [Clostridia bacterium]|nr:hypothetical protein [Clostridia bacterium]